MNKIIKILLCFVTLSGILYSCKDDSFSSDSSHKLSFSTDTLSFDTVFTTVGSATHVFMMYNKNKKALNISQVKLGGGESSPFRINVSGVSGTDLSNVEIWAKDSMYVFVEVTVDPTVENLPFLIEDSILFYTNTNVQRVKLLAYGQNARIFRSDTIRTDTILTGEKPHLIYGDLVVEEGKTLTIDKGCNLYFHANANLIVKGNLIVNGTLDEPVLFRGDRLDYVLPKYKYDDLSGQWGSIQLIGNTGNHSINYAFIRNGMNGIIIENTDEGIMPVLKIENTIIHNFDSCGVRAKLADVTIGNSQLSNCAHHCLKFTGGKYQVVQSTIANYYTNISTGLSRKGASVLLANYDMNEEAEKVFYPLTQADFLNSIIYGKSVSELTLQYDKEDPTPFNFNFSHCSLRNEKPKEDDPFVNNFTDVTWNKQPQFKSTTIPFNYRIGADTTLMGKANIAIAAQYPIDLAGNMRLADGEPDLGAYEYVEETTEN